MCILKIVMDQLGSCYMSCTCTRGCSELYNAQLTICTCTVSNVHFSLSHTCTHTQTHGHIDTHTHTDQYDTHRNIHMDIALIVHVYVVCCTHCQLDMHYSYQTEKEEAMRKWIQQCVNEVAINHTQGAHSRTVVTLYT